MHGSKGESDALGEALQHLADDHPAVTTAAKRIVELAKGGKCSPDRLCEQALSESATRDFSNKRRSTFNGARVSRYWEAPRIYVPNDCRREFRHYD
jgi:hypothetical protein